MKLILLQDCDGHELEICQCPESVLSSMDGLRNFLRLHAVRTFGGREEREWRICQDRRALVPLSVNQLVPCAPGTVGAMAGCKEYGQQLVIK